VEKFIRQLPLVIAIILMISNCESANDPLGGNDGSSGGSGGWGSSGGSGSSTSGGSGQAGPGVQVSVTDPSDSVVVDLPQQIGGQWQNLKTRLSTVTKYDIYNRLTGYYQDMLKTANNRTAGMSNQTMQMGSMQQQGLLFQGGGAQPFQPINPMGQPYQQVNQGGQVNQAQVNYLQQAAQVAQMNQDQLNQYAQRLGQEVQALQAQNQQLQMQLQMGGASNESIGSMADHGGDFGNSHNEEEGETECAEDRQKLEEIAHALGVEVGADLVSIVEEKIGGAKESENSEEGKEWEEKYQELAALIPVEKGEAPEEALQRLFSQKKKSKRISQAEEPEEENDQDEDEERDANPAKRETQNAAEALTESPSIEEEKEPEEMEEHIFDLSIAPKSLTAVQEEQLQEWRARRGELMKMAGCALSETSAGLTTPQEWALLREAFDKLRRYAQCPE
jgi:hypothetical protein